MTNKSIRDYINLIENAQREGVAEGLPQTLRKVVPGYAKREIDKKMDAGKFGKTDADKDANFQRYKKIQDKLKEQGVAEGELEEYGDTNKGQKMLGKVHQRAADRVTSKQADKDPAYARKAQQTQDRAWDRLKDK